MSHKLHINIIKFFYLHLRTLTEADLAEPMSEPGANVASGTSYMVKLSDMHARFLIAQDSKSIITSAQVMILEVH
jgi:hypothetical protein